MAPPQARKPGKPPSTAPHLALLRLSQSNSHQLQTILQAVAQRLCSLPDRQALASWLGQQLDEESRLWLRAAGRLRLVTVLQHHADDFFIIQEPQNVTVIYLHKTADKTFMYADQIFTNTNSVSL
eukprot:TRINITY_DN28730_c0_g1_i12.p3 TRINITY_DN28730_c0_g1~~TRINITY_DN28730_c0_g1_i12.p3  ORF type:complete len:125 (+),score=30.33 TRINITY_DN28730_c0_g1_i12:1410-1784(+)